MPQWRPVERTVTAKEGRLRQHPVEEGGMTIYLELPLASSSLAWEGEAKALGLGACTGHRSDQEILLTVNLA